MKNPRLQIANLPCGTGGLNSNYNVYRIPINQLVRATNIRFDNLAINKAPGIAALGSAISGTPTCLGAASFYPSTDTEVALTAWSNGNIYKESANNFSSVNLGAFGATADPVVMVPFTNLAESATPVDNRMAFFSAGATPKQVIGTSATFTTFTAVSPDWASTPPAGGVMHDFRLVAFGVDDYPHNLYFSTLTNLSDFTGAGAKVMSVYSGEGNKIIAAATYLETQLVVWKDMGIYIVDTSDLTAPVNPAYRITTAIGAGGPNGLCKVNGDIWFISDQGRIHSLLQLRGDIDPSQSDLTHQLQLTEFIKRNVDLSRVKWSRLHFDPLRQEVIYSYSSIGGTGTNDQAIIIRLPSEQNPPMVSIDTRGAHYNAIWSRRESSSRAHEVLCAGEDGVVAQFNAEDRNVLGDPFDAVYSHPATDFSYLDPRLASVEKAFKFLQLQILPTGVSSDLTIDIIVDGVYRRSETITLSSGVASTYGSAIYGTSTYAGTDFIFKQIELDVTGSKIQFVCYNTGVDEEFSIVDMNVVFEVMDTIYEEV